MPKNLPTAGSVPRYITISDACEILGVCEKTVRNLIASGHIPAYRLGGRKHIRLKLIDVEAALVPVPVGGAA